MFFVIFSCFLDNQTGQHFPPPTTNFGPSFLQNVPSGFPPLGDFRSYPGPIRNPNDEVRGFTLLELERERLRDEIILSEIARRRELEMEVRREIMLLEREIGMRREVTRTESLLFSEDHHRLPMVDSFDKQFAFSSSRSTAFSLALPSDVIALEFNSPSEANKDKLIVLVSLP